MAKLASNLVLSALNSLDACKQTPSERILPFTTADLQECIACTYLTTAGILKLWKRFGEAQDREMTDAKAILEGQSYLRRPSINADDLTCLGEEWSPDKVYKIGEVCKILHGGIWLPYKSLVAGNCGNEITLAPVPELNTSGCQVRNRLLSTTLGIPIDQLGDKFHRRRTREAMASMLLTEHSAVNPVAWRYDPFSETVTPDQLRAVDSMAVRVTIRVSDGRDRFALDSSHCNMMQIHPM